MIKRTLLSLAVGLVGITAAQRPAHANTFTYDLSGNPADAGVSSGNYGSEYVSTSVHLTDVANHAEIPGFTFSVGDTIQGTVSLTDSLHVPISAGGTELVLDLFDLFNSNASNVYYKESFSLLENGTSVQLPNGYEALDGSGGILTIGGYSPAPTNGFSFNKIDYSVHITSILDNSYKPITSVTVGASSSDLVDTVYPISAAPEPSAWALIVAGIGGIGLVLRRKRNAPVPGGAAAT